MSLPKRGSVIERWEKPGVAVEFQRANDSGKFWFVQGGFRAVPRSALFDRDSSLESMRETIEADGCKLVYLNPAVT